MHHVPPNHTRFYADGPDWPQSPGQQAAEHAYRDAFLAAAREAGQWEKVDHVALERAWGERRQVRESARVLYPSAKMFGCPEMQSDQVIYREGHELEAARTRGRVHGFEFVRQCWDELVKAGVEQAKIGPVIIRPWIESVAKWVARDIDPERICPPPRPDDMTERQRRMLNEAKRVIAKCDPKKPHAILQGLAGVTRELLDWLWPGRIPLGKLTLLCGDPGLGKSCVTLDLAARVSRGDGWPDMPLFKQTPGDVILLNCEDDVPDTIAPRLDKAGADDNHIFTLEGIEHQDAKTGKMNKRWFSLESDLSRLDEALGQFPDIRLVVIDPIAAYLGNVDSHKNAEVRGLLAPLAELAGRHRVAIVTVTHLSKSGGTKAVYRAMGSLAFAAAARAVWAIVKDQDDHRRRLFLPGKLNLADDPDGLAYRIRDGRVEWEPDPVRLHADDAFAAEVRADARGKPRDGERQEAAEWIREELTKGPRPASELIELGEQYGFSERTLRRAYKQIGVKAKKESFGGPWIWQLANPTGHEEDNSPPSL
ncbi:MAG: AAA family ATPase [Pirellulaceae bacterium]